MTSRKIFLPIALGVYSLTAYASFHAYKLYLLPDVSPLEASDPSKQPDVSDRYGTLAKEYDDAVGWDEWMMGLPGKRRELLRWAHVCRAPCVWGGCHLTDMP